jgi:RHS repeat-associated protein
MGRSQKEVIRTRFGGMMAVEPYASDTYPTPNRIYSGNYGRWLSPDPLGGDVSNPQSLNRYAYVMNNPTTLIDPLGLDPSGCTANASGGVTCSGPDTITVIGHLGSLGGAGNSRTDDCLVYAPTITHNGAGTGHITVVTKPGSTPTWLLQTKVFVSALGQNFVNGFKEGGCVNQFLSEMSGGATPPGVGPEDVVRTAGQAAAANYALSQGLTVPLRSSIYRGILANTETASAAAFLIPFDYEAGKAFIHEMQSLGAGACQ